MAEIFNFSTFQTKKNLENIIKVKFDQKKLDTQHFMKDKMTGRVDLLQHIFVKITKK